jgi:hypothetical protein
MEWSVPSATKNGYERRKYIRTPSQSAVSLFVNVEPFYTPRQLDLNGQDTLHKTKLQRRMRGGTNSGISLKERCFRSLIFNSLTELRQFN